MKKVLATVAAFGLVAGVATTASALDFSVTGSYVLEGYYVSDTLAADRGVDLTTSNAASDSYYMHTFSMLPTMKVNDKITMKGDIRFFKEATWGSSTEEEGDTTNSISGKGFDIHKIYMEYMSPVGLIRVGRVPTGAWEGAFYNNASAGNRIMWYPEFLPKPWQLLLFTQKSTETSTSAGDNAADADIDVYEIALYHTTDTSRAVIKYDYTRDANTDETNNALDQNLIQAYGLYNYDNLSFEVELAHLSGDATATRDRDAWGAYVDVNAKFDNLTAGLMYVYASGDQDGAATGDNEAFMDIASGLGDDFRPLYILTGDHTAIFNSDALATSAVYNQALEDAGVHLFALHADYKVSDRLTLHGAIAFAQADEEATGYDDEIGMEYNIGAAYKLLDNLTYEAHFGYFDTGDWFKEGTTYSQINEVTLLSHHLTMKF